MVFILGISYDSINWIVPPLPVMANDGLERNPSGNYYREGGFSPRCKTIETGRATLGFSRRHCKLFGKRTAGWDVQHEVFEGVIISLKTQRSSILVKEEGLMNIMMECNESNSCYS